MEIINNYDLEFIINGTLNEYDLQSVHNANSYIDTISDLPQITFSDIRYNITIYIHRFRKH